MIKKLEKIVRKTLVLPSLLMFSVGAYAQGLTQSQDFFQIQVHPEKPQLDEKEYMWFKDLAPAIDYDDGTIKPEKIIVFEGDYYHTSPIGKYINNKWVQGAKNPKPTNFISQTEISQPKYNANVHFVLSSTGNSIIENLVMQGNGKNASAIIGDGIMVKNCYFKGDSVGVGLMLYEGKNNLIEGNVFSGFNSFGIGVTKMEDDIPMLRDNIIFGNEIGIGYANATSIDLGKVTRLINDSGSNVFNMNKKNMKIMRGQFTPAQGNYWYNDKGELLTKESDILDTIELVNPTAELYRKTQVSRLLSFLETINVVPYKTEDHPLFAPPITSAKHWGAYF